MAALEKNEEYKEFSQKNGVAFYPKRLKLLDDDNQIALTASEKSAILYMNNRDVGKWYINQLSGIKESINPNLPLRERAMFAFNRRNDILFQAREKMADFNMRTKLDTDNPNHTLEEFENFVLDKMKRKGLTREEAYLDIINTTSKTNADVNKDLRIK